MKYTVLIVGNFLSSSGGSRGVCEDLADQLTRRGWNVIKTSSYPQRIRRMLDIIGTIWRSRTHFEVAQVDVYSGLAFISAEVTCWMLRLLRKRYVLTLRGGALPQFADRWPGRVKRLLDSAAKVTVPSGYLLEAMRSYRCDLLVIPNSIHVGRYSCRTRSMVGPQLVWLRAFHKIYNPLLAPQVIARLVHHYPEIHLTMVGADKGDGSLQATQNLARRLGVMDHISWPGGVRKAEIPKWLGGADILINTTNIDNTPVSVLEALASGLCIVSTNVGGIPYLLGHEEDALLVPPDSPDAMASAVRRVITEPELALRISTNARLKVEKLDWVVVVRQWEELLLTVANADPA